MPSSEIEEVHITRPREWWHRYLAPQERRRVMTDLAITTPDSWTLRFYIMLTMAVVVATMGLLANSAAVVIGAMLLAPLMVPVLGTAASLAMGLPRKIFTSTYRVVLATLWCIAVSYGLSMIIRSADLGSEILSRTRPDVKDLIVALAAGIAGAYATVRKDASASLPGVAVAVALVPPLAVVGITLHARNYDFARGALLLYTTNLAAIIFAGVIVFVITGFVPPRRLATTTPRIVIGGIIAAATVVALALPLQRASSTAVAASDTEQEVIEAIDQWIDGLALERSSYKLTDDRLSVVITGPDAPPDDSILTESLRPIVGDIQLDVQWTRTQRATTTTTAPTTTTTITDEERRTSEAFAIVNEWLAQTDPSEYELTGVFLDETGRLRIVATGIGDPPGPEDRDLLRGQLADAGFNEGFRLNWTPSLEVEDGTIPPTPVEVRETAINEYLAAFFADSAVTVESASFDGDSIRVELVGPESPDVTELTENLVRLAGTDVNVEILFVERVRLTTTTTETP